MKPRIAIRAWRFRLAVVLLCVSVVLLALRPLCRRLLHGGKRSLRGMRWRSRHRGVLRRDSGYRGPDGREFGGGLRICVGNDAAARASANLASGSLLTYAWRNTPTRIPIGLQGVRAFSTERRSAI